MTNELRKMLGIDTGELEIALVNAAVKRINLVKLRQRARKVVEAQRQYLTANQPKYIAG